MSREVLFLARSVASRVNLVAGLAAACAVGPAAAAAEDGYPQGTTRPEILRWLADNSNLTAESVVTMTDDLVVAITAREDGRGADRSTRLTLREEVIAPDAAAALGGRSVQLDLDLDCPSHRVLLGARRIYERPNLQGSVRITRSDNVWTEVPADTVVDEVARAACSPGLPARLAAVEPAPPSAPAREAAAAPAPSSQPQLTQARTGADVQAGSSAPARSGREPANASATLNDPFAGGVGLEREPIRRSAVPAAPAAPAGGAPRIAEFAVQIAASDSADLARDSWQSLKARLPDLIAPRTFAVEPVSASGRTVYRALLLGFASQNEAAALCKALRGQSVGCVLRQMK